MNLIIDFIFSHAHQAHWIIFSALILAGLHIPISEDLMIIISAILASTIIPEHTLILFLFLFFGCFISDIIVYWLGRTVGGKLLKLRWFKKTISISTLDKIHVFYKKHGFLTLLVGRFIPFGVRNCLFLSAGLSKMYFPRFLFSDGIACFISNSTLFSITYALGKNYTFLLKYVRTFNLSIFIVFVVTLIGIILHYKKRKTRITTKLENQKITESQETNQDQ
jgi:membrane protein DedA with SNARE-associated domain